MLLFAFSLWSDRQSDMLTGVRYFTALMGLLIAALDVGYLFIAPHMPLAFRVLNYLALTLLVITDIVAWPRKHT